MTINSETIIYPGRYKQIFEEKKGLTEMVKYFAPYMLDDIIDWRNKMQY